MFREVSKTAVLGIETLPRGSAGALFNLIRGLRTTTLVGALALALAACGSYSSAQSASMSTSTTHAVASTCAPQPCAMTRQGAVVSVTGVLRGPAASLSGQQTGQIDVLVCVQISNQSAETLSDVGLWRWHVINKTTGLSDPAGTIIFAGLGNAPDMLPGATYRPDRALLWQQGMPPHTTATTPLALEITTGVQGSMLIPMLSDFGGITAQKGLFGGYIGGDCS